MVYKFFDKKNAGSGIKSLRHNKQLPEELLPLLENLKKEKGIQHSKKNIWVLN